VAEHDDDVQAIRAHRDEIAAQYGDWTAHDIQLTKGISTRPGGGYPHGLRRCLQLAADVTGRPIEDLRVLDLGALEGQYAIEFAMHGAETVAIEGRKANIEKARVAQEVLKLHRLRLLQEDVRCLSRERHGTFDVVLCLGLLYHLDAEDVFSFLSRLAEVCRGVLILDTHIALRGSSVYVHDGHEYRGLRFVEHDPRASNAQRSRSLWASLDNAESFWLTRASLLKGLTTAGFTSVMTAEAPIVSGLRDRVTVIALKGRHVAVRSSPTADANADPSERHPARFVRNQNRGFLLAKRVALRALVIREQIARGPRGGGARPS
jgi:2-polyprenyl-3-methyl-5-hydroxy-6-metoxy-1,4-benzoquinol methylase